MKTQFSRALLTACLLFPSLALAQSHNRGLERIAVWPESTGTSQRITAVWTVSVEPASVPRNLSTVLTLYINSQPVGVQTVSIVINAGSQLCELGPPCSGGCGSMVLNGGEASLLCYRDGTCTPQFCDCDCGQWLTAEFPYQPVQPGDEISVRLVPTSGALPDIDHSDDSMTTPYHGRPIGWDRGVTAVGLQEIGAGLYDVTVYGSAGWESQPGVGNLDMACELRRGTAVVGVQQVPAEFNQIFDQTCFQNGCFQTCGTFNGIERTCAPYIWWDCACSAGWIAFFPGVQLLPGEEISATIVAAPGSLPEVTRPNDNDKFIVFCCTSDAPGGSRTQAAGPRLEQNRPNPAGRTTAIDFELTEGGPARVEVFDIQGRLVRVLLERVLGPGRWSVGWDGEDASGRAVPAGIYTYRLTSPEGVVAKKLILS